MRQLLRTLSPTLVLLTGLLCAFTGARASHLFGADFYYTWVSGNTYNINLVVYADCSGSAFPTLTGATPTVEVYNGTTLYQTLNLSQNGVAVEVTPVCASQINNTTCNGGLVPGVKKFVYTGAVTLNTTSSNWRFRFTGTLSATSSAGRSNSITNIVIPASGSVMILEATLNNIGGNNSNANYTTIPTPFFCINKPQQYNPGAVDPNNDSLAFGLVDGLELTTGTVSYIAPYTAAAPLATSVGSYSFSTTTGQLNFTPNLVQKSLVVSKVTEYRSGVQVGTSMREMTFVVLNNCNNNPPDGGISNPVGGVLVGNTGIKICGNQGLLSFAINPTDIDGDIINVTAAGIPAGAIFNVTGNNTTAPAVTFSWNVNGVAPGNYNFFLTYTDQGCPLSSKQTIAYTVTVLPVPAISFQLISPATCTRKAVFSVTPGGAPSPYVLNIIQGSTIIHSFSGLTGAQTDSLVPGTYTFTVKDVNNCQKDTIITIASPPLPSVAVTTTSPTCQGGSNGSISATATSGTAPFQYALGSGAYGASGTFNGLLPGSYVLHIRDASDCVKDTNIVLPDALPIVPVLNFTKPPCNAFQSGAISVNALNGTAPYEYALGSGAYGTNNVFTALGSGYYVVHIKDANSCTKDTTVLLPDSIRVQANIPIVNILCNGQATGSVTLNASGTIAPYTYALGSGVFGSNNVFSGLTAGTYTFHIKDPDGCYLDTVITLTEPTALSLSAAHTDASCFGASDGSITITASGATPGYTYSLNGGAAGSSNVFSGQPAGTHTVTVTDANNCSQNIQEAVQQPTAVVVTASLSHPSCPGGSNGSITIAASGGTPGYTYALDAGAYGASGTFGSLGAGTYTLHAKDAHNCIKDTIVTLVQPDPIVPSALVKKSTCSPLGDGSVTLSAVGGTPAYTYAVDAGSYGASPVFSPLAAGTYIFHIKDANSCIKDTSITVVDSIFVSSQVTITDATCFGAASGAIDVTGTNAQAPYTYALGSGSYQSSGTFPAITAGTYVLHIKDANGCIKDTNVTVAQPPMIVPSVTMTQPLCFGQSNGSISLGAAGGTPGYTFALGSGSYSAASVFGNLAAGPYVLHVKDNNGCIHDTSVTLAQPPALAFSSLVLTDVLCFGESNGTVTINATGGTPAYSYAYDANPFQAIPQLSGFNAGSHAVHLKDANGCQKDTTITMKQPDKLFFGPSMITTPTCEGFSDGVIILSATGGVTPYVFAKGSGGFSGTFTYPNLPEGLYTFHVKDANGCTRDTTIDLKGYPHILVSAPTIAPVRCFGESNGSITLNIGGGVQPLSYQKVKPLPAGPVTTDPLFDSLKVGRYSFIITDSKGCRKDTAFTVTEPERLVLTPVITPNDCEGLDDGGGVKIDAVGGTQPYSYLWSTNPVQTVPEIRGLPNGQYMVWVKDANGCTDSSRLDVLYDNCCKPFVPDAFTPNGDGLNDLFRIRYKGDMTLQHFSIYNRLGQRVFTTASKEQGWDGTYMGTRQDVGTYFYYIKIICGNRGDKTVEFKGDVTLIR